MGAILDVEVCEVLLVIGAKNVVGNLGARAKFGDIEQGVVRGASFRYLIFPHVLREIRGQIGIRRIMVGARSAGLISAYSIETFSFLRRNSCSISEGLTVIPSVTSSRTLSASMPSRRTFSNSTTDMPVRVWTSVA